VLDLDVDAASDFVVGIADRQVATAHRRTAARFDLRSADAGRCFDAGHFNRLQLFKLLGFALRAVGGASPGFVLVDEGFQAAAFGHDRGIYAFVVNSAFFLIDQESVDLAVKDGQLAA
jgi:hypothetical protein